MRGQKILNKPFQAGKVGPCQDIIMMNNVFKFCPYCGVEYKKGDKGGDHLKCSACDRTFYQNSAPTASAIIVKDDKVLLGRRGIDPKKGTLDAVGGFCEPGEHPEDSLRREVMEETELDVYDIQFMGVAMDEYDMYEGSTPTMNIFYIVRAKGEEKPRDDVAELEWFDAQDIPLEEVGFDGVRLMLEKYSKSLKG